MIKYKYSKVYWFFRSLEWMRVYFSPFKPIIPRLYIGKIAIGTPYFLPRRLVKATPKRAHEATKQHIAREESYNKLNPSYARTIKPYNEILEDKMKCSYSEPKTIGFDFVGLVWKTKWRSDDYRHEWNPRWSFVFFGYQIALIFAPENDCHYWESFLAYSRETDKSLSWRERVVDCRKRYPQTWTQYSGEEKITTDYWNVIIKEKYLK